jgi:hypothetical protein
LKPVIAAAVIGVVLSAFPLVLLFARPEGLPEGAAMVVFLVLVLFAYVAEFPLAVRLTRLISDGGRGVPWWGPVATFWLLAGTMALDFRLTDSRLWDEDWTDAVGPALFVVASVAVAVAAARRRSGRWRRLPLLWMAGGGALWLAVFVTRRHTDVLSENLGQDAGGILVWALTFAPAYVWWTSG